MSIRLEDEKASLMGDIDGTKQLPIAYEPMEKERIGCRSKGKCAARLVVRLACTIIAICGMIFYLKHFSPLPNLFGEGTHNPLRYYPGSKDQAAELPIPTSIPTSLPKPPSPPKPPQPPHLPDHIPHHFPHPPHHGPPLPVPIECLDISDAKASVNLSLTLDHPWSAIHLDHTLDQATINIQHEESSRPAEEHNHPHGHPPPPPPPPPPPHHPHGHPPHGKPETVMVTVSRTAEKARQTPLVTADSFDDEKKEKKEKKVYVCALKLPFAGTGLGLFHHKPPHKKHEGSPEDPVPPPPASFSNEEDEKEKEPKDPHGPIQPTFPSVSLAFRFPAGAPFNIKSGLPVGPPPPFGRHGHHKGLPWWHRKDDKDHEKSSKTGFLVVVTKMVNRMGCAGRRMMSKGE